MRYLVLFVWIIGLTVIWSSEQLQTTGVRGIKSRVQLSKFLTAAKARRSGKNVEQVNISAFFYYKSKFRFETPISYSLYATTKYNSVALLVNTSKVCYVVHEVIWTHFICSSRNVLCLLVRNLEIAIAADSSLNLEMVRKQIQFYIYCSC